MDSSFRRLVAALALTALSTVCVAVPGSGAARAEAGDRGTLRSQSAQTGSAGLFAGLARGTGTADARMSAAVDAPVHAQQWALERVQFARAWAVTRGRGVVVALLDSGVDASAADLRGRVLQGATFTGAGYVHHLGQADGLGHGTHVAGIVAASPATARGVSGGAPEATVLPVKVLGDDGSGWGSDVADGLVWAVDHGADVVNMSLGSSSPSEALRRAVLYAQAHGVLVVAASGNTGPDGYWEYPSTYPDVLTVGATDPGDRAAPFSTTGPFVDVSAPGESILSTVPRSISATGLARMSGTSMSAPWVAAAAALVLAASPGLSGTQVAARLQETAEDLGAPGPDDQFGAGLVDPARAVGATDVPLPPRLPAPSGLAVHALADRSVGLTWEPVEGAGSYEVLAQGLPLNLSVEDGGDPVYGLHGSSAHFPSFPHGVPVPLQVVAVDGRGLWSSPSATLQALVAAAPVAGPTALRGASPHSGTVVVGWTAPRAPDVVGYAVLRDGEVHDVVEPEVRRYVDLPDVLGAPVDGRAYSYRVVTLTAEGESDPSAAVLVRPYASWLTSAPSLVLTARGTAVRVAWSRPVRRQRGWRVFLDGALLEQLPVGATHLDVAVRGTHRVTVVRFRSAADQGPRSTATLRH
ncbi:MAG: Proprotein convertase in/kexin type 6 [Frankiales bacterium]|nr:Proprotein convertase in/kexin type 6 [Frankiales bacterium]